jgi:hypothetical protein
LPFCHWIKSHPAKSPVGVLGAAEDDEGEAVAAEAEESDDAEADALQPKLAAVEKGIPGVDFISVLHL